VAGFSEGKLSLSVAGRCESDGSVKMASMNEVRSLLDILFVSLVMLVPLILRFRHCDSIYTDRVECLSCCILNFILVLRFC